MLDQEPAASLGGQAFWSFGGLFLVNSPEQRRLGVQDSARARARRLAGFRGLRPRRRTTGRGSGRRPMSTSRPARSGPGCGSRASSCSRWCSGPSAAATRRGGHGNSVPRFHVTWGTGPGVARPVRPPRHASTAAPAGSSCGSGTGSPSCRRPAASSTVSTVRCSSRRAAARGEPSSRGVAGDSRCERRRRDRDLGRDRRQPRPGPAQLAGAARATRPADMLSGVPDSRRRPDARRSPKRRARGVINRGPDVALPGGRRQPLAGLDRPRHPDPVRPDAAVAGRAGAAGCRRPLFPGLRRAGRAAAHHRAPGTGTRGSC